VATPVTVPYGFPGFGPDISIRNGWAWTVNDTTVAGFNVNTGAIKQITIPVIYQGNHGSIFINPDNSLTFFINSTSVMVNVTDPRATNPIFSSLVTLSLAPNGVNDGATAGF
jgi:hypothetical protein